ncbi:hypothetical protein PR048_021225 [Dryococelus australis]|uniref:Uncharacterized protein n=1 Tax=Dryococelus australis TaxID=614101 RepID=A0ABQ9GXL0_9NEOP|nr:hypothetical protein PR048_021225 [Dryococelus australis]
MVLAATLRNITKTYSNGTCEGAGRIKSIGRASGRLGVFDAGPNCSLGEFRDLEGASFYHEILRSPHEALVPLAFEICNLSCTRMLLRFRNFPRIGNELVVERRRSKPDKRYQREIGCQHGRGGVVVRLLTSHNCKPGSIPGGVATEFSHVGIVLDDAAGRRVFSIFERLLRYYLTFPRSCAQLTVIAELSAGRLRGMRPAEIKISRRRVEEKTWPCDTDATPRQQCSDVGHSLTSHWERVGYRRTTLPQIPRKLVVKCAFQAEKKAKNTLLRSLQLLPGGVDNRRRQQHIRKLFVNRRLVYLPDSSPKNRDSFGTPSSQSHTRSIPNVYAQVKRAATPFHFRILTCSVLVSSLRDSGTTIGKNRTRSDSFVDCGPTWPSLLRMRECSGISFPLLNPNHYLSISKTTAGSDFLCVLPFLHRVLIPLLLHPHLFSPGGCGGSVARALASHEGFGTRQSRMWGSWWWAGFLGSLPFLPRGGVGFYTTLALIDIGMRSAIRFNLGRECRRRDSRRSSRPFVYSDYLAQYHPSPLPTTPPLIILLSSDMVNTLPTPPPYSPSQRGRLCSLPHMIVRQRCCRHRRHSVNLPRWECGYGGGVGRVLTISEERRMMSGGVVGRGEGETLVGKGVEHVVLLVFSIVEHVDVDVDLDLDVDVEQGAAYRLVNSEVVRDGGSCSKEEESTMTYNNGPPRE